MFFNLECLPARVRACVVHLADGAEDAVSEALQPRALADATSSSSSAPSAAVGATGVAVGAEQQPTSPTPGGSGIHDFFSSSMKVAAAVECWGLIFVLVGKQTDFLFRLVGIHFVWLCVCVLFSQLFAAYHADAYFFPLTK